MELTDLQKRSVKEWGDEGCGLADIQKRLAESFGISMTYMDVRFLAIDLKLRLKEKGTARSDINVGAAQGADRAAGAVSREAPSQAAAPKGGVSLQVDRVTAPGSLVSGSVTFSDGVSATWRLDQFGRLALSQSKPGYTPTSQDVQSFQKLLSDELMKLGF